MKNWFSHNSDEKFRLPISILAIYLLLKDGGTLDILGFVVGMVLFLAVTGHYIRKLLFPYVKLSKFFAKALETPFGASIAILAILMFSSFLIHSAISLLHSLPK